MPSRRKIALLLVLCLVPLGVASYLVYANWDDWFAARAAKQETAQDADDKKDRVKLSLQGLANLQPNSQPLTLRSHERSIELPGIVVDRPGITDRGIPAPVAGIVTQVHVEPGLAVAPGDPLFTMRIASEYLQNAQAELFKTSSEMARNRRTRQRLTVGNVVPEARLIDLDQQHERLEVIARAHTQDLLSRGLTDRQIKDIENGNLIREVQVLVPDALPGQKTLVAHGQGTLAYEVQELKVEVGHKVEAGQLLALLANHHSLAVEGRAFAQEAVLVEKAARSHWAVHIDFIGDQTGAWSIAPPAERLKIRSIGNMIDPNKRTLVFQVPIVNQGEAIDRDGQTFLLWRYRPGQRARVRIPVEQWDRVFVVPVSAIVKEGPEVYVFQQGGVQKDGVRFTRRAVRLLYEDRKFAVLHPDDSDLGPGQYIAQQGAAVLNRILKTQGDEGGEHHHHDHPH